MPNPFIWYDYMADDAGSALAFYQAVFGWTVEQAGQPERPYAILSAAGVPLGGLLALPPEASSNGGRPGWIGYVGVADTDVTARQFVDAGGGIHRATEDLQGVGRFAVVHDPQGAALTLFQPAPGSRRPLSPRNQPGHVGWHELHAVDGAAAFAFYAAVFGWTKDGAVDMGPMGLYQLFATGDDAVGGIMTKPATVPAPFWAFYFNVEAVDAALSRVEAAGGALLRGPHQVPGDQWVAQCRDPQGGFFCLVGPAR